MENNSQTVDKLIKVMSILPRFMQQLAGDFKTFDDNPLKKNEVKTLFAISMKQGMPMKHYLEIIDLESGSFTYMADKLEDRGFIRREHSEKDKRVTVLYLTDEGRGQVRHMHKRLAEHMVNNISGLDESDIDDLVLAADIFERVFLKLENAV